MDVAQFVCLVYSAFYCQCTYCWCFLGLCLLFLSTIITRIVAVATINTAIRAPTAPRVPAMRLERFSARFVTGSVPVFKEEEGEKELMESPLSPAKVVVANHYTQSLR